MGLARVVRRAGRFVNGEAERQGAAAVGDLETEDGVAVDEEPVEHHRHEGHRPQPLQEKAQQAAHRGILGSLAIVTVLYVAVALVVTGMVPYTDLATPEGGDRATLATAFEINGVTWAATIVSLGALIGLTTVVMVLLLGQTRVLFAMSRDGLVPRGLAKTHPRRGTPVRATLLVGVVVLLAAGFFPADKLEEMVNVGTLFAFILVSLGVIVLRRTRPDLPRGFRAPLVPVVPILAIVSCLWLMLNLTALTWVRFVVWMIAGVVIYFLYSRSHSVLGKRQRGEIAEGGQV